MKRIILAACAPLALSACNLGTQGQIASVSAGAASVADAAGVPKPTLQGTAVDEKAITLAAKAVDVAAVSASALVAARVIEPGTPKALAIAEGLDRARDAVNAAAAARNAGNATSYTAALADAEQAVAQIRAAIGSN